MNVTCPCQHCKNLIEFDAADIPAGESRVDSCPHCSQATVLCQLPCLVTCRCQICNGVIEFDSNELNGRETATVECPYCMMETILFVPNPPKEPQPEPKQNFAPQPSPTPSGPSKRLELFYYKTGNTEKGPYTFEQLRSLWKSGQITGDALYRSEHSSEWAMLSARIGQALPYSLPPLPTLHNFVLRSICIFSLIAFFLPNAVLSIPIYGKVEVSMFDFLTPKSTNPALTEQPSKPHIADVIDTKGIQVNKENIGAIICVLSILGVLLHYLLTLVWGVLAFALKRTFSVLNLVWLFFALQFPILFSMGVHLIVSAAKTSALREAANAGANDSTGEALGAQLGAALVNNVSLEPGAVMWVLMAFAFFGIGLPSLARKLKLNMV
jgi:hypothetical protein